MQGLKGNLRRDEPMSRHTSWRTGGPAKWFYTPNGKDDLGEFLKRIPSEMQIVWCGLGSNTLVRDGGFSGVVVSTLKGLNEIYRTENHGIYAQAGVPSAKLAKFSVKNSLCGTEFMVGIPGTVGGALAMNAGCFGSETWQFVRSADTITRDGEQKRTAASQFRWDYRFAELAFGEWFTGAEFNLTPCRAEGGRERISSILRKRSESQPVQTTNAGSVFRNPSGDYAARLLESAGLKGFSIGTARFSPVHSNFIENQENATAQDIENLISHAVDKVEAVHGIKLELEVRIIGNKV